MIIGERAGSGIPDVFSVWNKEFGIAPEYEQKISPERIVTILRLSDKSLRNKFQATNVQEVQDVHENVQENVQDVHEDVHEDERINTLLALIKQNPDITLKTLSEKLSVASKTIQRDLDYLKQEGIVERIGSNRKGQWKIIKG